MTKNFWEKNFDAFCESYIPNQYQEQETITGKAWTFALSTTLIITGLIAYFKFF
jgi:hypothetical protein